MKRLIFCVIASLMLLVACGGNNQKTVGDCELIVTCASVFESDKLTDEKREIIPKDGIIFSSDTVGIKDGDSVFDIIKRTMQDNKIHIEFSNTSAYNAVYIEGISNIYQQDFGEMSGWLYKVNGKIPDVAMSEYKVNDGDMIEVYYSCDFLEDM